MSEIRVFDELPPRARPVRRRRPVKRRRRAWSPGPPLVPDAVGFAAAIRAARLGRGITQAHLADELAVLAGRCSRGTVCRWEAGERLPQALVMLAALERVLGIRIDDFVAPGAPAAP